MDRVIYDIPREPRGEVYQRLIGLSLRFCNTALLVVRDSIDLRDSGTRVLTALEPYLQQKNRETEWPGTKLFYGASATVYRFRLCSNSGEVLKGAVDALYCWQQPQYPEDLCLLRSDGQPWLVSIAHESISYLELSSAEKDVILVDIPGLGPLSVHSS